MKQATLLVLFLHLCCTGFAQSLTQDSTCATIKAALATAKSNFRKNNTLGETQANEVFAQAKANPACISYYIDVHNLLALFKMDAENYEAAKVLLEDGLAMAIANKQQALEDKIKGNIGLLYFRKAEYQKCITTSLELLPQLSGITKAHTLGNIAASYNYLNQFDLSLKYQQEAMDIYKPLNNKAGLATGYNLIGSTYTTLKKYAEAQPFLQQSFDIKKEAGDTLGMCNTLINLGMNADKLKDYTSASNYFDQAEVLAKAINNESALSKIYTNKGVLASRTKDFESAKSNELKALDYAKKTNDKFVLTELYKNLGKTFKATGNLDSALLAKDQAITAQDSLMNLTVQAQIADMQTKYETVKKEKQIEEQKATITKRNYAILAIIGSALLLSLLAFAIFNRYKLKKKNELQQKLFDQQQIATINVINAEEKERKRIASDLHDGVGQLMTAAWLNMQAIGEKTKSLDAETAQLLSKTMHLVDESCKEVRAVSHNMMPNALLKKGLVNAIREFISQINLKSTKINLHTEGLNAPLPSHIETILYRVIQESVNNVVKHANATSLDISIIKDESGLDLMIEDNGKGFNFEEANKKDGIGLQNIKSRIEYLQGSVEWSSSENNGTVVAIHIPESKQ
jgi:two-component system, NarL family, sensor kinase